MVNSLYTLIGSGNLAGVLAHELSRKGVMPSGIVSRTTAHAEKLATKLKVDFTSETRIFNKSRFVLIAVSDDAIPVILEQIGETSIPVFHVSGSTSIRVFPETIPNHGVLYPLQTFSAGRTPNFSQIPVFIEYSNERTGKLLHSLAHDLSTKVVEAGSEKRLALHISAVFACNFLNFMLVSGERILRDTDMDFEILQPLIYETLEKAIQMRPSVAQTGPARREDRKTIEKHMEYLEKHPDLRKLYTFVSENILNFYSSD